MMYRLKYLQRKQGGYTVRLELSRMVWEHRQRIHIPHIYRLVRLTGKYKIRYTYYSANLQCKMWSIRTRICEPALITDEPLHTYAAMHTGRLVLE